jgi:hypothetical protein
MSFSFEKSCSAHLKKPCLLIWKSHALLIWKSHVSLIWKSMTLSFEWKSSSFNSDISQHHLSLCVQLCHDARLIFKWIFDFSNFSISFVSCSSQALNFLWRLISIDHSIDQFLFVQLAFRSQFQLFKYEMISFYRTNNNLRTRILKHFFIFFECTFSHVSLWMFFATVVYLDESSKSRSSYHFIKRFFNHQWFSSYVSNKIAIVFSSWLRSSRVSWLICMIEIHYISAHEE